MICPKCGNENRPGARFCSRCGALLQEATPAWPPQQQPPPSTTQPAAPPPSWQQPPPATQRPAAYPPESSPQPPPPTTWSAATPPSTANRPGNALQAVAGKAGPLGGHSLLTIGGLIALFAFMLPWASCSSGLGMDPELSGLDIVTQSSQYAQYGGNASWTFLTLVPLGALALLALGILGLAADLGGKSLPVNLTRWVPRLPLVAILAGLCGLCPSCAFFLSVQKTRSDPSGLGTLINTEYGFWLTLFGLILAFVGMAVLLVTGSSARQKSAPP